MSWTLVERVLWHVPTVGRLSSVRDLTTNQVSEVFEIEYEKESEDGTSAVTAWSELDNPEMSNEFLQDFITHTSNVLDKYLTRGPESRLRSCTDYATGKPFWMEHVEKLEFALDLMFAELGRRADDVKA